MIIPLLAYTLFIESELVIVPDTSKSLSKKYPLIMNIIISGWWECLKHVCALHH